MQQIIEFLYSLSISTFYGIFRTKRIIMQIDREVICRKVPVAKRHERFVKNYREDGGTKDWVMIELQGDLKHSTGDACKSRFIGDLHFAQDGTPILIIGVHVLYGKETNLAKPLALLEKIEGKGSDDATVGDSSVSEKSSRYVVKAIVKKKLIFKGRPKPIVTDVPICI